jgi:hypothetical protein
MEENLEPKPLDPPLVNHPEDVYMNIEEDQEPSKLPILPTVETPPRKTTEATGPS